ncbi:interferon-induced very large GTPase 1-like [Alosa alosa]|uniref:interferon-induced very large GTPase 1-like n=1 Tax=Alosa alosa TaxID=278164 RepID=UPI0020153D82|nr:interferon-induced very large GTPase 1-like [Alosa alosa]
MTKSRVLVMDELSLSVKEPQTEKDLSFLYLYKLMTLDYRARYLFVKSEEISMDFEEDVGNVEDDGDDFFDCDDKSDMVMSSKQAQIHPMDLHMAIFHCSSDFLRQYIFTKLSTCQFSLPFLVPNPCTDEVEFPLWALRHIRKTWHSKTASDTSGKYHNRQMFNTPVPIISFIRLGVSDLNSKSQMLDGLISKQKHSVFFHRHCKGSTPDSLLMNGVVEIAWYCPGGKKDDTFHDCVAFLNLHGNAEEHPKQLEFLQAVSTVNVLLLSEHSMSETAKKISQDLSKSPVPLICLFSVSAGRCTRGAFMQLVKVDSSIRDELGYDYVLIVDTEGLRSPELSTNITLNHDNELATFIIGIGDMTVINIMGENPSEMHDILEICVQAFLRMKQVKITPSCIFVHQNVAESSAGDKNIEGRRRLLEKLDEMAEIAAKQENAADITCFSDVIQFDIETQVFYFKNLLEGDPPMAPPNSSYSQNVQELKSKILGVASWQEKSSFPSLSQLKNRVSDLWTALLQENFVFSFKNTVEMMVYTSLEHKYSEWTWTLRKHSLNLQTKLENQIGSNLIQDVTFPDLAKEFDKVYNPLKTEIERYFREDKNKETLVKWKTNIDIRIVNLKSELIEGTVKKCKELLTSKQNRRRTYDKGTSTVSRIGVLRW